MGEEKDIQVRWVETAERFVTAYEEFVDSQVKAAARTVELLEEQTAMQREMLNDSRKI